MILRPYQQAASAAIDARFSEGHLDACIEIPTGGGKTPVMAMTIKRWFEQWPGQVRVAVVAHTKELVRQNAEKLLAVWPDAPVGICCAGLGRVETAMPVIYGSIQTMVNRSRQFAAAGGFDVVMMDEAHHIPSDRDEGTYKKFLEDCWLQNPQTRVVGLTATPYRLKSGTICGSGDNHIFSEITYRVGVDELIEQGYLSKLRSKHAAHTVDTSNLHVRGGEFRADEMDALVDGDEVVAAACDEMIALAGARQSWIVFCVSIAHAEHVARALNERGIPAGYVHSKMDAVERDQVLAAADSGTIRALCNVNVLSEGYDNPRIDCVVMLRPTLSPGLYYQQVGRGFRLSPDKENCLVLDFAGNILRHGPIDAIIPPGEHGAGGGEAPSKVCPQCQEVVHLSVMECPACGHEWEPEEKPKHDRTASDEAILSTEKPKAYWLDVDDMRVNRHTKASKPDSVRIDFYCGYNRISKWLCPDHSMILQYETQQWLMANLGVGILREDTTTDYILRASRFLNKPDRILIKPGKFPQVMQCEYRQAKSAIS